MRTGLGLRVEDGVAAALVGQHKVVVALAVAQVQRIRLARMPAVQVRVAATHKSPFASILLDTQVVAGTKNDLGSEMALKSLGKNQVMAQSDSRDMALTVVQAHLEPVLIAVEQHPI